MCQSMANGFFKALTVFCSVKIGNWTGLSKYGKRIFLRPLQFFAVLKLETGLDFCVSKFGQTDFLRPLQFFAVLKLVTGLNNHTDSEFIHTSKNVEGVLPKHI